MTRRKPLSRRTFLKGAAGAAVALPFLDAMLPTFASAQGSPQFRFVTVYYGSCNGGRINPSSTGLIQGALGDSISSLENIKQHLSVLSSIRLPQVNNSLPGPGEASQAQHGKVESPMLSGVRSIPKSLAPDHENAYSLVRGTTADQFAAMHLGAGSKFPSLQLRVQAADYNNTQRPPKAISVVKNGSVLNEMRPTISPLEIYNMLFTGVQPGGSGGATVGSLPMKKKSVLDLVLDDANRLMNSVGGSDKERLEQHFENIRQMERSLGTGSTGNNGACALPTKPGSDPAISSYNFGGWSNETLRGEQQAEMIAHALQCGLTHVVSWALTTPQTWINSAQTANSTFGSNSSGVPDIHSDSHSATSVERAANHNWAVRFFGLLVDRLSQLTDDHGTILDHTFVSFIAAEDATAHGRGNLTYLTAGCPGQIRNGHHINTGNAHPAQVQVSGLQAIGMNANALGEVTGNIAGLMI